MREGLTSLGSRSGSPVYEQRETQVSLATLGLAGNERRETQVSLRYLSSFGSLPIALRPKVMNHAFRVKGVKLVFRS